MLGGMDQPDQFMLICRELRMSWHDSLAKECHRSVTLIQDCAEADLGCVALDHKLPVERQQLEH
jgi:hypothetical protein